MCGCHKFAVFGLGLTKNRDTWGCIFPSCKEVIVGFAALLSICLRGIGTREAKVREWGVHLPPARVAGIEDHSELRSGLSRIVRRQVGLPETIGNVQGVIIQFGLEQKIGGFRG